MPRRPKSHLESDPLWYKDAVIYQLHVKSFFDGNNDGIGDFPGLNAKLDYIASLGVNAVWLLPFYPSPRKDDGYDIADYMDVHPDLGTLADFDRLLTTPESLKDLTRIAKILSPKGLMPNKKTGTVTSEIGKAVNENRNPSKSEPDCHRRRRRGAVAGRMRSASRRADR